MTRYLHGLPINSAVGLRGPYLDVEIPDDIDEVLFLAGGTGIAPALQVAHILARRPGSKIHILWANRRRDECQGAPLSQESSSSIFSPLTALWRSSAPTPAIPHNGQVEEKGLVVQVIDEFKQSRPAGAFEIQYFVDEEDTFIKQREVQKILANLKSSGSNTEADKKKVKLIMVSGPDGFVDYWAGKKRLIEGGLEIQGPLEGRLGQLNLHGWRVWKM